MVWYKSYAYENGGGAITNRLRTKLYLEQRGSSDQITIDRTSVKNYFSKRIAAWYGLYQKVVNENSITKKKKKRETEAQIRQL
jgi:hypothetical protein